jgi:hypothetical protein
MAELAGMRAAAVTRWHGWLDVKKGRRFRSARVPVMLEIADGELRITVTERRLERPERLALGSLGDDVLGQVLTGRDPCVLRLPLAETRFTFPRWMPRRSVLIAEREGMPTIGVSFLDLGDTRRSGPWQLLHRILTRGAEGRRRRDAVRAEIEATRASLGAR